MKNTTIKPFKKVLVANRGEIAIRVFRALNELGITTVGIFSKEDRYALFRTKADEAYPLNPEKGPIDAYLDIDTIIKIALSANVDAIHPGYGFLSENPDFVDACEKNGIVFIGPSSDIMNAMGDKISSKQMAIDAEVPIIPGVDHAIKEYDEAAKIAAQVGFPIMLKASNGGGGRGMRIVNCMEDLGREFEEAKNESKKAFGDDKIFIEKYLRSPKHIEVQILGDNYGNVVHLFDRDCSVQRRHQKVVEYAPAFSVPEQTRQIIFDSAIRLAKKVGYRNAGTLEFLVDADNHPYFIEMNPRIQVEHTVSEMVTGIDLVQSQILIAEGYPLDSKEISISSQDSIHCNGYSIQTRVTTEDPSNNFLPDTGEITVYRSGSGNGIRLDGGNAYTGAVISPYYDSLLVKAISHDRTFEGAVRKSIRAMREMRIRGVKTNIPFLINVLNHSKFVNGQCYTTFIEETPELFQLERGQDRATKIIEFLGDKIVNSTTGPKGFYENRVLPKYDRTAPVYGARDEFLKLGAEGFMQKIKNDKKLYVTDTTMRDAQQSLMATRMRTKDLCGAAYATNAFMQNAFSVEAWGGATYDTAYRFLKESPWKRLTLLRERMPNTLIQMLLRASNAVGYSNYPDNVVKEFIRISAEHGIDVFRVFDSLNWVENMKMPIEESLKTGKIVEGTICYTGDITSPSETKYTLDYYVKKALELEALGCHAIAIKDMAGLLKPLAAKKLVTALKDELNVPLHLHTHDSTGNGVSSVLMAAEAGVDIVDLAIESMSSLTSQPSMNAVTEALRGTQRDTGLDFEQLDELSRYYGRIRKVYAAFESDMKAPNAEIYKYEIPGGQYSNLLAQVTSMGSADDFESIKSLYKDANDLLGNIVKVTPTSKAVGDLAIFMFKNNLTKENILTAGAGLSYPDSVVDYFKGMMGQPDGGFPAALQKIVLKDIEPLTERPGRLLPPEDLEAIKKHLIEKYHYEDKSEEVMQQKAISYALYPKVYEDYCDHFEMYNDVTRLESHVYFYGLRKGEETYLTLGEGKEVLIKYLEASDPDVHGIRTLSFQVNGSIRTVRVQDKNLEIKADQKLKADKSNPCHLGSSIPGTVGKVLVKEGDKVTENMPLMTVEAMKMETTVVSKVNGSVDKIYVSAGDSVNQDDLLVSFIIEEEAE
ncbi:2-oxoglutarate carboxylase small subunit [uncultured Roseburia sp.]|uniref:Pyruvate carboxylase n=1 Tax=Brotonthovivens ammoniilytica TaxID=2981725 RepID=A0ABT2TMM1_9FIRM|nr:pyruvate carboxylase [Brotonthovivens ammoniilytica]MCU6763470.1 pyruvate carboxylase [Brotonthovivens ammoniilytica]SCJ20416.1 2-oxoglutarate carboxylase small subunit [uncultured Roseburia sp.]